MNGRDKIKIDILPFTSPTCLPGRVVYFIIGMLGEKKYEWGYGYTQNKDANSKEWAITRPLFVHKPFKQVFN